MDTGTGSPNDGLKGFGFSKNRNIGRGPAFGCSAISEQARCYGPKLVIPAGNHRSPGGPGAARSRHEHDSRAGAILIVINAALRFFNHGVVPRIGAHRIWIGSEAAITSAAATHAHAAAIAIGTV